MKKVYFDSARCLGCHSCEFACAVEHSESKDQLKAHLEEDKPIPRRNVQQVEGMCLSVACRHCEIPYCVEACIAGAMAKKEGEVSCDTDRCVGCWMCVMVCPFDAVHPGEIFTIKCDMCPDLEDAYACIEACPTGALFAATAEEFKEIVKKKNKAKKVEIQ